MKKEELQRKKELLKKQKRIKKKKRALRIVSIIFIAILVLSVALLVMFSPLCNIKKCVVEGNVMLTEKAILDTAGLPVGHNAFKASKGGFFDKLFLTYRVEEDELCRSLDLVESAKIQYSPIGGVAKISIKERVAVLRCDSEKKKLFISSDGAVFETNVKKLKRDYPLAKNLDTSKEITVEDYGYWQIMIDIVSVKSDLMEKNLQERITAIDFSDKNNFVFYVDKYLKVNLGEVATMSQTELNYRFKMLKATIEQLGADKVGVLDFSSSEYPYFTPKKVKEMK